MLINLKRFLFGVGSAAQAHSLFARQLMGEFPGKEMMIGMGVMLHKDVLKAFKEISSDELLFGIYTAINLDSWVANIVDPYYSNRTDAIKFACSLVSFSCFALHEVINLLENPPTIRLTSHYR